MSVFYSIQVDRIRNLPSVLCPFQFLFNAEARLLLSRPPPLTPPPPPPAFCCC